ncbi:MAG TPA: AAA family ATPase [Alphaproteobacteria bacterium]|nr:AAA family ATPase [Alphaproteobacteria bacterium]
MMSKIIFLNGCSSSGKTTISKAIQHFAETPWLLIGVDTFIQMMPNQYTAFGEKASEGYAFIPGVNERGVTMEVRSGPFGKAFFETAPYLVRTLADQGFNIIVDEVLLKNDTLLQRYISELRSHTVYFIQVTCDLKTMQEREITRQDRAHGLANAQFDIVHEEHYKYDMTVDTTRTSAFDCAQKILNFISHQPNPEAFKELKTIFSRMD